MRHYITVLWKQHKRDRFPYGTLFVNLTGALMIGVAFPIISTGSLPIGTQELLLIGFLGAYTTFSSYVLDTNHLFRNGHPLIAVSYWVGSPLVGLVCVEIGLFLGQKVIKAMTFSF